MRIVHYQGNHGVDVIDVPEPEPSAGQVLLRVTASALCGTEHTAFEGGQPLGAPRFNAGHEAAGEVVALGPGTGGTPGSPSVGDRVVVWSAAGCGSCRSCRRGDPLRCARPDSPTGSGTHAQFVTVAAGSCLPLADDVPDDVAAVLTDAVGTPLRALRRLRVDAFDTVVITGQGPVGLAATMLASFLGARVVTIEPSAPRRDLSAAAGADHVLDPASFDDDAAVVAHIRELVGPVTVAVDCSAHPDAQTLCLDVLAHDGRMGFVGVSRSGPRIDTSTHMIVKELELIGSWYSRPGDHPEMEELLRRGLPVERLITDRVPIDEAPGACERFFSGQSGKVVILPWG